MKGTFLLIASILFSVLTYSQTPQEKGLEKINQNMIKAQLEFLASDWTDGRETGTEGAYMASDYIASIFQMIGLKPAGDISRNSNRASFFQNFNLVRYKATDDQIFNIHISGDDFTTQFDFKYKTDFTVNPGSVSQTVKAPLVFVGYGYKNKTLKYDDFKKVDIRGKIIIRLSGYPGHADTSSVAAKQIEKPSRWRLNKNKNAWASEAGAVGIIEITSNEKLAPSNVPFRYEYRGLEGDDKLSMYYSVRRVLAIDSINDAIPTVRISKRVKDLILEKEGINTAAFENAVAQNLISNSKALKKSCTIKTNVKSELIQARNVLGKIEGKNPDEIIVVGAHYDHLGHYNGHIYNGADDNASGTVGIMAIAQAMLATGEQPEKTIIFAAWDAEESGLWGSRYFVANYPEINKVVHNLNYDMISRDEKTDSLRNKCKLTYHADYEGFNDMTRKHIEQYGINLDIKPYPSRKKSGGSDFAPFAKAGISYHYFFAAMHEDYHLPQDETNKVNYDKMESIIKVGFLNIHHMANNDFSELKYTKQDDE